MSLSFRQNPEKLVFWAALFVGVLAFLSFIPALGGGLINWDDTSYYHTQEIKRLDLRFLKWAFSSVSSNWHPLTVFSHGLGYAVWGLDPFGHHLINVILHSINAVLVALLGYKLTAYRFGKDSRTVFAALVAALIFALHPLRVESVAWVSERKDVLSMLFFLLSINSYLSYAATSKRSGYVFSLIFFTLSLLSKPMAVTLPLVLLIIDFYPLERLRQGLVRIVLEKIPYLILSIAAGLLTIWAQRQVGAISTLETYPLTIRLWVAVKASIFYLYKTIIPLDLAPYYPHPVKINPISIEYLGSLVVFIGISVFCALTFRRYKAFTAAWLYYVITLLPVAGIVQVGGQAAADRYTYMPTLSLLILIGVGAGYLFNGKTKALISIISACLAIAMITLTVRQIPVWKDSVTFWSYTLKECPTPLVYLNRAMAYEDAGRLEEALSDYTKSLELKPRAGAYNNRARVYHAKGEYQKAIEDFDNAIAMNPSYAEAYNNRGLSYRALGDNKRALEDFATALRINPRLGASYINISVVYSDMGELDAAAAARRKAAELGY